MSQTVALVAVALLIMASLAASPSHAQLGTSANPPPQRLFETDRPQRLDTGLGPMADRQPRPTPAMRRAHAAHRRHR